MVTASPTPKKADPSGSPLRYDREERFIGSSARPLGPASEGDRPLHIVPNAEKAADGQPDFRVLSKGSEIGAGWTRRAKSSGNDYVSLSLAQPEFGPRRLYANLGRAAGAEDGDTFALIWNPQD